MVGAGDDTERLVSVPGSALATEMHAELAPELKTDIWIRIVAEVLAAIVIQWTGGKFVETPSTCPALPSGAPPRSPCVWDDCPSWSRWRMLRG
jgi:hypothetical protein